MDSTEKTVLIVGGLGIGAVILFSLLKQANANQYTALNQPGLNYQPSIPSVQQQGQLALGNIISSAGNGLATGLQNLFSSIGNASNSYNEPGLEDGESDIAYPGNTYTYSNSNNYSPTYGYGVSDADLASVSNLDSYSDPDSEFFD